MGPLILPANAVVYLDAQAIIYTVEHRQPYYTLLRPIWAGLNSGTLSVFTSQLSILEVLVHPLRANNQQLLNSYDVLLADPRLSLLPVTDLILRQAAQLRAFNVSLKAPDAIHLATLRACNANCFVTNDRTLRRHVQVPTLFLDDLIP